MVSRRSSVIVKAASCGFTLRWIRSRINLVRELLRHQFHLFWCFTNNSDEGINAAESFSDDI